MRHIGLILLSAFCLLGLAACSSGGGSTGGLRVTIRGLPAGAEAAVTVTGPSGFSQTVTATTALNSLAPGSYTITANSVTEGGVTFTPAPATQQATVTAGATATATVTYSQAAPDYSLSLSDTSLSIVRGGSGTLTVTLDRTGGFTGDVTLSLEDAPTGVSGSFSPTLLTGSIVTSTLTIDVGTATAEGGYTLRVVGTAGSETREASFTLTVSSVTASGTVVDVLGQPVANLNVKIGNQHTTTAPDGSFTLSGVTVPYDATVYYAATADKWADVFEGLTRSDPTLQVLGDSSATALTPLNEATVSGTLTGGSGFPLPANTQTIIGFGASGMLAGGNTTLNATGGPTYPTSPPYTVSWTGANTVSGTLQALQVTTDATTGFPTSYPGYGTRNVSYSDGGTFPNQDIDLGSALSTLSLSGNVQNLPMGFDLSVGSYITLNGDTTFPLFNSEPGAPTTFSFLTPDLPGSTHTVAASASSAAGEQVLAWVTGLAPNASGVTLTLPAAPPQPISPADAATGVTTDTAFNFSSPIADAVTVVQFFPSSTGPTFHVVTTRTEAHLPDLSAEGLGLPPGATYTWSVTSLAPFADMDAVAGPRGYLTDLESLGNGIGGGPERDMVGGTGASRGFTTAP